MNNRSLCIKVVLTALVVVLLFFGDYLHPDWFKTVLEKAGSVAPLVLAIFMALAVMIPFFPSLPLDIAAGAFFGPVAGTVYCAAGAAGGAVAAFLISRYYGREFVSSISPGTSTFAPNAQTSS